MDENSSLRELIWELIKDELKTASGGASASSFEAEVLEIDKVANTCKVKKLSTGLELEGIRLISDTDSKEGNTVFYPVVGSTVVVAFDTVSVGGFISKISATSEIMLNGGENGGLILIEALVDKLNILEQKLNDFIIEYKAHNHAHPIAPTVGLAMPSTLSSLPKTAKSELENKNVKH